MEYCYIHLARLSCSCSFLYGNFTCTYNSYFHKLYVYSLWKYCLMFCWIFVAWHSLQLMHEGPECSNRYWDLIFHCILISGCICQILKAKASKMSWMTSFSPKYLYIIAGLNLSSCSFVCVVFAKPKKCLSNFCSIWSYLYKTFRKLNKLSSLSSFHVFLSFDHTCSAGGQADPQQLGRGHAAGGASW